jgi:RNA polymerase sigma-70 factor (ECF subfamily)
MDVAVPLGWSGVAAPLRERMTEEEFASAFQASWRGLWCIAAAVAGDRWLAEDALQEAALIGMSKMGGFVVGTSFEAWMGQIVRNVARNMARRRARDASAASAWLDARPARQTPAAPPVTPRGAVPGDQEWFDDRLLGALRRLEETARACLLLRTILDLPYREIALLLDIPQGTAMSHVHRSRHELRARLSAEAGNRGRT